MKFIRILIVPLVGVVFLTSNIATSAAAQKSVSYKGLSLTPAIVNVNVDQALQTTSVDIVVSNDQNHPVLLGVSSVDFKSLNQTGGVAFIGSGSKYGLADWLTLPKGPVTISPHSSRTVSVGVDDRSDLSPGGHYAAILFKDLASSGQANNQVGFNQVLASLVFLKKSGGEVFGLSLAKPAISAGWLKMPSNLDLLITNTGNTQTAPRGIVSITDPLGRQIKRGIINPDSNLVLPGSARLYQTSLNNGVSPWLPGRYTLTVTYRPDDIGRAKTASYSFIYLSLPFLLIVLAPLVGIALTIRSYILRKRPKKIFVKIL